MTAAPSAGVPGGHQHEDVTYLRRVGAHVIHGTSPEQSGTNESRTAGVLIYISSLQSARIRVFVTSLSRPRLYDWAGSASTSPPSAPGNAGPSWPCSSTPSSPCSPRPNETSNPPQGQDPVDLQRDPPAVRSPHHPAHHRSLAPAAPANLAATTPAPRQNQPLPKPGIKHEDHESWLPC
jgi:hypothetical protein